MVSSAVAVETTMVRLDSLLQRYHPRHYCHDAIPDSAVCHPYNNMRWDTGDAVKLLTGVPSHSLDGVLITFPDQLFDRYYITTPTRTDGRITIITWN